MPHLVSITPDILGAVDRERFSYYIEIFAYNCYYSPDKLYRDVPEFQPTVSLEQGMAEVLEAMDRTGMIPDSEALDWEDKLIKAQRAVASIRID